MDLITDHLDIWTTAQAQKATGRGKSVNNQRIYGIQKLSELILELALHGKLVSQNPNDEPATALLERIAKEKVRLTKEGKIWTQKCLPEIIVNEKPFDLVDGWEWAKLGNVGQTRTGGTPRKADRDHFGQYISFIKPGDIYPDRINYKNQGLSKKGENSLRRTAPEGSILMVCIGTIGKCNLIEKPCCFNQQINAITPYINISRFLLLVMNSRYFKSEAWARSSSTTIAILNKGKWSNIPVPIPPLAEQHRIVAKVDQLMTLCDQLEQQQTDSNATHQTMVETLLTALTRPTTGDDGVESNAIELFFQHFDTLFTTEQSIDQLKQTILQLAVMGRLVPQDPSDVPASVLLKRIAKEKARLIKVGKIKKQKPLPQISNDEAPFELPTAWEWENLSNIVAVVTDGDHQPPPKSDSGVPFLVIGNLNSGEVVFDGCRFVPDTYYENLDWAKRPTKGDILYTVTGSYGIPILVRGTDHFCVQRHVAIFKATSFTPSRYLSLVLVSKYAFRYATEAATGIAQKTVPLAGLRKMPIPVPPLAEQNRIVTKVDELMACCDALKARLSNARTTQLQLADTIVEQAVV